MFNSVTGVTANIRSLVLTVSTQFYWGEERMEGGYWWCHWCFCKYMFLGSTSAQFNWGKWKGNKRMTGSKEGWILGVSQGKAGWLVACLSSWGKTTRRGNNEDNYFGRFRSDRENCNLHIIIVQWLRWEIWNYESLTDWLTHRVIAGMDGMGFTVGTGDWRCYCIL